MSKNKQVDLLAEVMANLIMLKEVSLSKLFKIFVKRYEEEELVQALNSLEQVGYVRLEGAEREKGKLTVSKSKTRIIWTKEKEE